MSSAGESEVLFIGGFGRSGSTLLDRLLGQLPGFVSLGEVKYLWERGLLENQSCGCGEPFRTCPFWTAVGLRGFGGWDRIDVAEVVALMRAVDRHRYVPFLAAPNAAPAAFQDRLRRIAAILTPLYAAIRDVAGVPVMVDSSVDPSTAILLRRVPGIDLRVAHLIRDSRGVAMSWAKRVVRPEVVDRRAYMPSYRPTSTALRWDVDNALFDALRRAGAPTAVVRYEDVVAAPRATLIRLARLAGRAVADADLAFVSGGAADLGIAHTVAGNPMRFETGRLELRVDDAWRSDMPGAARGAVWALTWPLLRRYGYRKEDRAPAE